MIIGNMCLNIFSSVVIPPHSIRIAPQSGGAYDRATPFLKSLYGEDHRGRSGSIPNHHLR